MKKLIALVLVAGMLVLTGVGCSGGASTKAAGGGTGSSGGTTDTKK